MNTSAPNPVLDMSQFDFEVPPELVAQEPLPRGTSRMLVAPAGAVGAPLEHRNIADLPDLLSPGDLVVLNNTRVLNARLHGQVDTGAGIEILLLEPVPQADVSACVWRAMVRPGRKLPVGRRILLPMGQVATVLERSEDGSRLLQFEGTQSAFLSWLEAYGEVPLPPYVRRKPTAEDSERYQTVWAEKPGAVAAPTAGLHLTEEILARLEAKGIGTCRVTLHVGAGTFQPVSVENALEHPMHAEAWEVSRESAALMQATRDRGGRIVCVGTTSLRTVETCWRQNGGQFLSGAGSTRIFLHPFDPPQAAQGLLTNFHWPRTTLILLVAGWLGSRDRWHEVYSEALAKQYRLFSYGDCMLTLR